MKPGTLVTKLVVVVIALAVAAYLVLYAVNTLTDPFETTLAYEYTMEQSAEVTGWLVRSEEVLPPQSGVYSDLVDIVLSEGEKVATGGIVARVYKNTAALELQQEISQLERELTQVRYIMSRSLQSADTAALDDSIAAAITSIHTLAAKGDLSTLSSQTEELRTLVYRREYTYSGDGGLEERAAALTAQLKSLRQQAGQSTTSVTASQPGIFSAQVDGYESVLTPEALEGLTPSGLEALTERQAAVDESTSLGKLITKSRWYLAIVVDEEEAKQIGKTATIRFSRDYTGEISMQVERTSDVEDGQVLVVLSTNRYLSETTLLRRQSADLIYDSTTGVRVPQRALRIITQTQTDKETGEETETQVTGVYVVTGNQVEWKSVNVLEEGEGFYLVEPTNPTSSHALRAGDEVVVKGENIFDGKVIRSN
jgi:hypothetical protein